MKAVFSWRSHSCTKPQHSGPQKATSPNAYHFARILKVKCYPCRLLLLPPVRDSLRGLCRRRFPHLQVPLNIHHKNAIHIANLISYLTNCLSKVFVVWMTERGSRTFRFPKSSTSMSSTECTFCRLICLRLSWIWRIPLNIGFSKTCISRLSSVSTCRRFDARSFRCIFSSMSKAFWASGKEQHWRKVLGRSVYSTSYASWRSQSLLQFIVTAKFKGSTCIRLMLRKSHFLSCILVNKRRHKRMISLVRGKSSADHFLQTKRVAHGFRSHLW